jgi:hypothetical protein
MSWKAGRCRIALLLWTCALWIPLAAMAQDEEAEGDYEIATPDYGSATLGYGAKVPVFGEDVYRVVRGDTLWGICSRFFGDPQQWPNLWSINNEEITNPHYIYPGQVLRFQPGTDIYPPQLVVGAPDDGDYGFDDEFQDVVRVLAGQRDCGVHRPFSIRDQRYRLSAHAFIVADPRRDENLELGAVLASPEDANIMGQNHEVYLRFHENDIEDVNCGDIYSIYRPIKLVRHPYVRRAKVGNLYRILGEALITDVNLRTDVATASLIESWTDIARGDLITDRIPVSSMVVEREIQGQIEGYIIERLQQEASLMQDREVLFIDRGRNAGVENGTIFWIMHQGDPTAETRKARKLNDELPQYVAGKAVVFSVEESFAKAVLVDAAAEISVGDRVYTVLEEADLR